MAITPEQIDVWRQTRSENQRLEFKEAKQQYDSRKLAQYCVAIANEGGGFLVLGVSDAPPRQVVGTNACQDVVHSAQRLFETLGFRVDLEEVNHPEGRVLVFSIPARPRGTAYHLDGMYLMRAGEALTPMSEDQLRRIFAEGKPDWGEEHTVAGLAAQEIVNVLDTQSFFELLKLPYPTDQAGVIDRLVRERLIDGVGDGVYGIRRVGALLLAKRLDDFPELSRKAPRVVVYSGTNKLETRLDQVGAKGYAVGFQGLVRFVMGQLSRNEVIYVNRIEISNPGEPIVPVDRFIDGYQSRNERLASLMRRMGICEEESSGIDRVVQTAEVYQLPAPDVRVANSRTVVVIFGPRDLEDMDRGDVGTVSGAGEQECHYFADYLGDDGGGVCEGG